MSMRRIVAVAVLAIVGPATNAASSEDLFRVCARSRGLVHLQGAEAWTGARLLFEEVAKWLHSEGRRRFE